MNVWTWFQSCRPMSDSLSPEVSGIPLALLHSSIVSSALLAYPDQRTSEMVGTPHHRNSGQTTEETRTSSREQRRGARTNWSLEIMRSGRWLEEGIEGPVYYDAC